VKKVSVKFPDGSVELCQSGKTVREIISSRYEGDFASIVAVRVNGEMVDLSRSVEEDVELELVDITSADGLGVLRHSISHIMAQAVQEIFEGVRVTIGPSIENGFYYDFEYSNTFTPEDLDRIEKKMHEIVSADYPFIRREMSREEAVSFFRDKGEPYKVELLNDLPEDVTDVSLYSQGEFVDLCRGPHIPSTGMVRAF